MVTRFVERAHYSRIQIDDELSAQILRNYIEALDPNRHYFRQSDITYFNRYYTALDDVVGPETWTPFLTSFDCTDCVLSRIWILP